MATLPNPAPVCPIQHPTSLPLTEQESRVILHTHTHQPTHAKLRDPPYPVLPALARSKGKRLTRTSGAPPRPFANGKTAQEADQV